MIPALIARIGIWWASKSASWILLSVLIGMAGLHYANLKAKAARCEASKELQAQISQLADRLAESIARETDERVEALRNSDLACLDERLPDELRDR